MQSAVVEWRAGTNSTTRCRKPRTQLDSKQRCFVPGLSDGPVKEPTVISLILVDFLYTFAFY